MEFSAIYHTLLHYILSLSMLHVIYELAIVNAPIRVPIYPSTTNSVILKLSNVHISVFEHKLSETIFFIPPKESFVIASLVLSVLTNLDVIRRSRNESFLARF